MRIRLFATVAVVFSAGLVGVSGCVATGGGQLPGTWSGFVNGTTATTPAGGPTVSIPSSTAMQLVYDNTSTLVSYPLLAFGDLAAKTVTINQIGQSVSFTVNAGGVTFNGVATVTNAAYTRNSSTVVVAISLIGPSSNGSGVQTLNANLNSSGTLNVSVTQNISYVVGGLTTTATTNASGTLSKI